MNPFPVIRISGAAGIDLELTHGVRFAEVASIPVEDFPREVLNLKTLHVERVEPAEPVPAPKRGLGAEIRPVPEAAAAVPELLSPRCLAILLDECAAEMTTIEPVDAACPFIEALRTEFRQIAVRPSDFRGVPIGLNAPDMLALSLSAMRARSLRLPVSDFVRLFRETNVDLTEGVDDVMLADAYRATLAKGLGDTWRYEREQGEYDRTEAKKLFEFRQKIERARIVNDKRAIDLAARGLFELTCGPAPVPRIGGPNHALAGCFGARTFIANPGLPAPPEMELDLGWKLRSSGIVEATEAELGEAGGELSSPLVARLRWVLQTGYRLEARPYARSWTPVDFTGSSLTVNGRHALNLYRAHCYRLASALMHADHVDELTAESLYSLVVAYHPYIDFENAVDSLAQAFRELDATGGRLPKPETVARDMTKQLAAGSPWMPGQAFVAPSKEEVRVIRASLQPRLFESTIAEFIASKDVFVFADLVGALHAKDLIGSTQPSIEENRRITHVILRSHEKVEVNEAGRRFRAWRRRGYRPPPARNWLHGVDENGVPRSGPRSDDAGHAADAGVAP